MGSPVVSRALTTEADNFQRANGPVGANWAGTGTGDVSILNNTLDCSTSPGSQLSIYWNASSNSADQYSRVTVGATVSTTTLGPAVRVQSGGSRYRFVWWSGSYYLQYMPGTGNGTNLQIVSAGAPSVGTVLNLTVSGTTLNAYVNGGLILTATDSNLSSGQPGIDVGYGMPVGNATSGWSGGDLALATEADNFQRANGPIGSNWAGTGAGNVSILNNTLDCSTSPSSQLSVYWSANTNGAAQFSQVTVGASVSTTTFGPAVRVLPGGSRYRFVWWSGSYYLQYMPGTSNGTNLQIVSASAPSVGTVLTLSVSGTTLNAYVNGALTLTASDSSLSSGQPGVDVGFGMPVGNATSGWVGGDLGALSSGLQVSPSSLSMLVGQSRTVSATDNAGNTVTGLFWTTTNSSVVSLSTDDPPLITAAAPGSATVYADDVPVAVTVYAGSALPPGTPLWSLPLGGSGSSPASLAPAVPSSSGVDVFALSSGVLSAIASDGTVVWTANNIPTVLGDPTLIPDFSGNTLLKTPYVYVDGNNYSHSTHIIQRLDPTTHQLANLYTFSDAQFPSVLGYTFSDKFAIDAIIPHPAGVLFVEDSPGYGSSQRPTVTVIDLSTGNQIQRIPFDAGWPWLGRMIVAGDGNAYVAYMNSANAPYPCQLLRVSPDGSSAVIDLDATGSACSGSTGGPNGDPAHFSVMTNADQGVAAFLNGSSDNSGNWYTNVYYVSQDVLVSQTTGILTGNLSSGPYGFWPVLQREDGSYLGTAQGIEPPPSPGASVDLPVMAMSQAGGILWQKDLGTAVSLLYATADGGVVVSSSVPGQLGTLYALDINGNVTSQAPDTGAALSWTGEWYAPQGSGVAELQLPLVYTDGASFWPVSGGNPSGNQVAIVQCPCLLQSTTGTDSSARAARAGSAPTRLAAAPQAGPSNPTTYVLLVGDPGLNLGPGHNYNVGNEFNLVADTISLALTSSGNNVVIQQRVSSFADFSSGLTQNGPIGGDVTYFGHGGIDSHGNWALFPGQNPGDQYNISALNVGQLSNSNLAPSVTITLNACHSGFGGDRSIAKQMAVALKRKVYAYPVDMYFSSDPTPRLFQKGMQPPQSVPAYMVPNANGIQPTLFTPN